MTHTPVPVLRGYLALGTVLVLSTMLMLIVFANGSEAYTARLALLHAEQAAQAREQSDACARTALRAIARNQQTTFRKPEKLSLTPTAKCRIESLTRNDQTYLLETSSSVGESRAMTTIRAIRNATEPFITISTWETH